MNIAGSALHSMGFAEGNIPPLPAAMAVDENTILQERSSSVFDYNTANSN